MLKTLSATETGPSPAGPAPTIVISSAGPTVQASSNGTAGTKVETKAKAKDGRVHHCC